MSGEGGCGEGKKRAPLPGRIGNLLRASRVASAADCSRWGERSGQCQANNAGPMNRDPAEQRALLLSRVRYRLAHLQSTRPGARVWRDRCILIEYVEGPMARGSHERLAANGGLVPLDSVDAEIAPVAFRDHTRRFSRHRARIATCVEQSRSPEKSSTSQNQSRRLETMGREPRTPTQPPSSPALLGVGRTGRQRIGNRCRRGRHPGRGGRGRKRM
jgi:hypothetical protein